MIQRNTQSGAAITQHFNHMVSKLLFRSLNVGEQVETLLCVGSDTNRGSHHAE